MSRAALVLAAALAGATASCAGSRPRPELAQQPAAVHGPAAVMLPAPKTGPQDPDTQMPLVARTGETLQCMDRELDARHLNPYGDRQGTTYAEGAPLGVKNTVEGRISYVFRRRPDVAAACARAPGEPGF